MTPDRTLGGRYRISTNRADIDVDAAHAYLTRSYWAAGVPRAVVERAIDHSLCFALLDGSAQIGLARVVTDRATYAYLCDVYILEPYQRQGLGAWLMEQIVAHPDLQGLRRFQLVTRDAHRLYERFGFTPLESARVPGFMEIVRKNPYGNDGR